MSKNTNKLNKLSKQSLLLLSLLVLLPACQKKKKAEITPEVPEANTILETSVTENKILDQKQELIVQPEDRQVQAQKTEKTEAVVPVVDNSKEKARIKSVFEDLDSFVLEGDESAFEPMDLDANEAAEPESVKSESWTESHEVTVEQPKDYQLKTVYFDFDKYEIRPDQKSVVEYDFKSIKNALKDGNILVIEGHACRFAGSAVYNMMLSEKRARAAANYLVNQGMPQEQIKVVGRGYEMCLIPEGDVEQQAANRRVEFYILN